MKIKHVTNPTQRTREWIQSHPVGAVIRHADMMAKYVEHGGTEVSARGVVSSMHREYPDDLERIGKGLYKVRKHTPRKRVERSTNIEREVCTECFTTKSATGTCLC